jgi:hypothetical protein
MLRVRIISSIVRSLLSRGRMQEKLPLLESGEDIKVRQGHLAVVDLIGKGAQVHTVSAPQWVKGTVHRNDGCSKVEGFSERSVGDR